MRLLQQGKKNVKYDHYEACNKRTFIIYLLEITLSQKKKEFGRCYEVFKCEEF